MRSLTEYERRMFWCLLLAFLVCTAALFLAAWLLDRAERQEHRQESKKTTLLVFESMVTLDKVARDPKQPQEAREFAQMELRVLNEVLYQRERAE